MKLANLTWPDVEQFDRDAVVIYPLAALEQHSRHLPFFTDSFLCDAVVTRLEAELKSEVLLLPLQWLGASEHHLGMAGTLTLESETYIRVICEPLNCLLASGFKRVLIVNGHGGNIDCFHLALRRLTRQFPATLLGGMSYWDLASKEIAETLEGKIKRVAHACEFETSLMLYLHPELVRKSEIADDGLLFESAELSPVYIPLDMKRQTRTGGVGYPTLATAEKGKALLESIVANGVKVIKTLRNAPVPAK